MKSTLQIVRGGNLRSHKFLWKKEWVRPYESPLSAYMNFVMLNALSTCEVKRYFDCAKESLVTVYRPEVVNEIQGGRKFVDKIYEHLLPYNPDSLSTIKGDFTYRRNFCYCPECIKQGYHSILSQIPFENICPIHGLPYVDLGKQLMIGLKNYTDYIDLLGTFPLPPERGNLDYSKIEEHMRQYKDIKQRYYISSSMRIDEKKGCGTKTHVFSIAEDFDYLGYAEDILNYYERTISEYLDYSEYVNTSTDLYDMYKHKYYSSTLSRIMEVACLHDYVKELDAEKYPGDYPMINKIFIKDQMPVTKENVKASYCYSVRGCRDVLGTFNLKYLTSYNSWVNEVREIDTALLSKLEEKCSRIPCYKMNHLIRKGNSRIQPSFSIENIIACECKKDQFWYMAEQFERSLDGKEYFDFYNHWKCLKPIIVSAK